MRRIISLVMIICCLTSCDQLDSILDGKPKLQLTGGSPYTLTISDFKWSYGMVDINKYSGDFEKLDHKVYDLLKGKTGKCIVYMTSKTKDQYGSEKTESQLIGELDLEELNKYESSEYWHKNAGIVQLLNQKYFPKKFESTQLNESYVDSGGVDSVDYGNDPILRRQTKTMALETFSVTHEELYPDEEDRASHDFQSYTDPINGIISHSDYFNNILEVRGDDGDLYALRIFPQNLSTYAMGQVRYFMRKGNRISCIATVAGARELEIVAAKFTLNQ
jgi:hypothetical protein